MFVPVAMLMAGWYSPLAEPRRQQNRKKITSGDANWW